MLVEVKGFELGGLRLRSMVEKVEGMFVCERKRN